MVARLALFVCEFRGNYKDFNVEEYAYLAKRSKQNFNIYRHSRYNILNFLTSQALNL